MANYIYASLQALKQSDQWHDFQKPLDLCIIFAFGSLERKGCKVIPSVIHYRLWTYTLRLSFPRKKTNDHRIYITTTTN